MLDQEALSKALETNDQANNQQTQTDNTAPTPSIKLGEKEYTQEELNTLIGVANQVKEVETRYNTKLDRVWPEYGRSQQRIKELEDEVKRVKEQPKAEVPIDQQLQIEEARKAARQLGILTKDDLAELGIVTKADLEQNYKLQRATEKLLEETDKLEKEINGGDGRPAFKKEEILTFMGETGIRNPETAYKVRYESQLDTWKETKLSSVKKSGITTIENTTGVNTNKQPKDVKITRDNLKALLGESLEGKF